MGGRPIEHKYCEEKIQRTLKRELKNTWNCWKRSEGNRYLLVHIPLAAWGLGAVTLLGLGLVDPFGRKLSELMSGVASTGFGWCRQNDFLCPVLKQRSRSLAYVWVQGCQIPVRNESESGWIYILHNPPASILWESGLSANKDAWKRWSQGKLWQRLVAILTCKLIVKFGYRAETLIKLSSSWSPLKFSSA